MKTRPFLIVAMALTLGIQMSAIVKMARSGLAATSSTIITAPVGLPPVQMAIFHEKDGRCTGEMSAIGWYAYFQSGQKWRLDEYAPDGETFGASHRYIDGIQSTYEKEVDELDSRLTDGLPLPGPEIAMFAYDPSRIPAHRWGPLGTDIKRGHSVVGHIKTHQLSRPPPAACASGESGPPYLFDEIVWLERDTGLPLLYEQRWHNSQYVVERQTLSRFSLEAPEDPKFYLPNKGPEPAP